MKKRVGDHPLFLYIIIYIQFAFCGGCADGASGCFGRWIRKEERQGNGLFARLFSAEIFAQKRENILEIMLDMEGIMWYYTLACVGILCAHCDDAGDCV